MCFKKSRCCAIELFCLKIGLPDFPLNSDNNSIGVLRGILRGASTLPFSAHVSVYFRAFPHWAAMFKIGARSARREDMGPRGLARMENEVLPRRYRA